MTEPLTNKDTKNHSGPWHPQMQVQINGLTEDIDVEIVDLILFLNTIPEIKTLFSCQGDEQHIAYVSFECTNEFILEKIDKLCERIAAETDSDVNFWKFYTGTWKRYSVYFKKHGTIQVFYKYMKEFFG